MEQINILNVRKPTIDAKLLIDLNQAGRNILAYIIDRKMTEHKVVIDKVDIINYLAEKISKPYANTLNVNRGLRDLIDSEVLIPSGKEEYYINFNLLSK